MGTHGRGVSRLVRDAQARFSMIISYAAHTISILRARRLARWGRSFCGADGLIGGLSGHRHRRRLSSIRAGEVLRYLVSGWLFPLHRLGFALDLDVRRRFETRQQPVEAGDAQTRQGQRQGRRSEGGSQREGPHQMPKRRRRAPQRKRQHPGQAQDHGDFQRYVQQEGENYVSVDRHTGYRPSSLARSMRSERRSRSSFERSAADMSSSAATACSAESSKNVVNKRWRAESRARSRGTVAI